MKSDMRNGYVDVVGGPLYYEVKGDGRAVVLIHAGFLDRRIHGSTYVEIPGVDHIANRSKPGEFNHIVLEFLTNRI
jgi:hypothetical protein